MDNFKENIVFTLELGLIIKVKICMEMDITLLGSTTSHHYLYSTIASSILQLIRVSFEYP